MQWLDLIGHLTASQTNIKITSRIKRLAFPLHGDKLITKIKSYDVLEAIKPLIDKRQLETSHRLHYEISSIFAYAIVHKLPITIPRNQSPSKYQRKK